MSPLGIDVAAGVILLLFIAFNYHKGIKKVISALICYVVSAVAALLISNVVSAYLYDVYVKDTVVSKLSDTIDNFDMTKQIKQCYRDLSLGNEISDNEINTLMSGDNQDMSKMMADRIKQNTGVSCSYDEVYDRMFDIVNVSLQKKIDDVLPSCAGRYFNSMITDNKQQLYDSLRIMYSDTSSRSTAQYIENNFIRSMMIKFMKIVVFSILYILLMIIIQLITRLIPKHEVPAAVSAADHLAGGCAGLVTGLVFLVFAAAFVKLMIYAGVSGKQINDEIINQTSFFKLFYNLDRFLLK